MDPPPMSAPVSPTASAPVLIHFCMCITSSRMHRCVRSQNTQRTESVLKPCKSRVRMRASQAMLSAHSGSGCDARTVIRRRSSAVRTRRRDRRVHTRDATHERGRDDEQRVDRCRPARTERPHRDGLREEVEDALGARRRRAGSDLGCHRRGHGQEHRRRLPRHRSRRAAGEGRHRRPHPPRTALGRRHAVRVRDGRHRGPQRVRRHRVRDAHDRAHRARRHR